MEAKAHTAAQIGHAGKSLSARSGVRPAAGPSLGNRDIAAQNLNPWVQPVWTGSSQHCKFSLTRQQTTPKDAVGSLARPAACTSKSIVRTLGRHCLNWVTTVHTASNGDIYLAFLTRCTERYNVIGDCAYISQPPRDPNNHAETILITALLDQRYFYLALIS